MGLFDDRCVDARLATWTDEDIPSRSLIDGL